MAKRLALLLLVFAIGLSGCELTLIGRDPEPQSGSSKVTTRGGSSSGSTTASGDYPAPPNDFGDANGMVTVRLEDGEAKIKLRPENWPDMPDGFAWPEGAEIRDIWFPVNDLPGRIAKLCVGEISELVASSEYKSFTPPAVIFLMEDGTLEWLVVNPHWYALGSEYGYDNVASSRGRIPWIENIVAFQTRTQGGTGATILAEDAEGAAFDLAYPLNFEGLFYTIWVSQPRKNVDTYLYLGLYPEDDYGRGSFLSSGQAELQIDAEDLQGMYLGSFEFFFAEDGAQGRPAGSIVLDMAFDGDSGSPRDAQTEIRGTFRVDFGAGYPLSLSFIREEGNELYDADGSSLGEYPFRNMFMPGAEADIGGMDDGELYEYLYYNVPGMIEMLSGQGLSLLITGDTTDIWGQGICRDFWVGSYESGEFAYYYQFVISPYGTVYEYDPFELTWSPVNGDFDIWP